MLLQSIVSIQTGHAFRGRIPEHPDATTLAVQAKDVSPVHGVNWQTCIHTHPPGKRKPNYLQHNDILLQARGNHNYAVLIQNPPTQALAAPYFFLIRRTQAHIHPAFLHWLLNQPPCQNHFQLFSRGSVTKSINRTAIENTPIVVPPLQTQHTIVALNHNLQQQTQTLQALLNNHQRMQHAIAQQLYQSEDPS